MSEIKTETHEGNIYELGQDYLFSDNKVHWTYGALTDLDGGYDRVFCTVDKEWLYIKEVPASENMGTITPAPIVFDHGKAYTFDCVDGRDVIGLYSKNIRCFIALNEDDNTYLASDCTNIRLMTVESK
jgi:hypothetical protein